MASPAAQWLPGVLTRPWCGAWQRAESRVRTVRDEMIQPAAGQRGRTWAARRDLSSHVGLGPCFDDAAFGAGAHARGGGGNTAASCAARGAVGSVATRRRSLSGRGRSRRGAAAVEAAFVLPLLITLMLGVWEAGRLVQVSSILTNAAREGARTAAGGTINGTKVTVAMVDQTVRDYLRAAGLPAAAVNGAQIQLVNTSGNNWTDPADASPGDTFRVTATIPAGAPFNSLKFIMANSLTNVTQLSVTVNWTSNNDEQLVVDTQLPY